MLHKIKNSAEFLQKKTNYNPKVGIILGTGLGGLVNEIKIDYSISYAFRGRGLGEVILKRGIDEVRKIWAGISLIAEVKEKNIASIKAITAAGFEQINSIRYGYFCYKFEL